MPQSDDVSRNNCSNIRKVRVYLQRWQNVMTESGVIMPIFFVINDPTFDQDISTSSEPL